MATPGRPLRIIRSFEAKELKKRPATVKIADSITSFAGSVSFLLINLIFFGSWIFINLGVVPSIKPFDPYPFVMLTTIVSLEAIMLAIFVLMSQNRQSVVSTLREEIQLQINLLAEREVTKILMLVNEVLQKQGIKIEDRELEAMLRETDVSYIERQLEKQLAPSPSGFSTFPNKLEEVSKKFKTKQSTS